MTLEAKEPASAPAARHSRPYGLVVLVTLLGLSTIVSVIAFNGHLVFAALPVLGFLTLYAIGRLPLRVPLLVLMFVGLTFENPGDIPAEGRWKSPLYEVGALLLSQLKHRIPIGALVMTGTDLLVMLLAGIYLYRRTTGNNIDMAGSVPMPRPLWRAAIIGVISVFALWIWGALRGGDNRFAIWQAHHALYLPVMFLFMQAVLQGPAQYRTLARVIVGAACLKSVLAVYLRAKFSDAEYVTTHHDSMLFAIATLLFVIYFVERRNKDALIRALIFLPILIAGMVANDRRLVWMQLGIAGVFIFALTPWSPTKIKLTRRVLASVPVIAGYLALGWNSTSAIFSPARLLRSVTDSGSDESSLWRDLENFNLVSTFEKNPVTGSGFGHPFEFVMKMPDVLRYYELEPYLPHNSLLGLWTYMGYVGFTGLILLLAYGLYFAARSYRTTRDPVHRTAALSSFCMIVIYLIHLYGDMALGTWTSIYLVATSLVMVGKLSVLVGAWPAPSTWYAPTATPAPVAATTGTELATTSEATEVRDA